MFPGFPRSPEGWTVIPNQVWAARAAEDHYTVAVLLFFVERTYAGGAAKVYATRAEIAAATRISSGKVDDILDYCEQQGYLAIERSGSHRGNRYCLRLTSQTDAAAAATDAETSAVADPPAPTPPQPQTPSPAQTIAGPRQESYREWVLARVRTMWQDEAAVSIKGTKLSDGMRKVRGALWAWTEIFGEATPCDVPTMVEMLTSVGGNPVKLARWLLRNVDTDFDGDRGDIVLLKLLKARLKSIGRNAPERGLNQPEQPGITLPAHRM
jgi:hypothetical protein